MEAPPAADAAGGDTLALHGSPFNIINSLDAHMQPEQSAHPTLANAVTSNIGTNHPGRTFVNVHVDAWRQSHADNSSLGLWGSSASPLPLDWLLQDDVPDQGWTAYLGDPGVPLLATFPDAVNASASRLRHSAHPAAHANVDLPAHATSISTTGELDTSRAPNDQIGSGLDSSQGYWSANVTNGTARSAAVVRDMSNASSPSMTDAAAAAATLARIRSAPVCRGFLRSGTPSEDASGSSRAASPDAQDGTLHRATSSQRVHARDSLDRVVDPFSGAAAATPQRYPPQRLRRSYSESSDVDPMEVANRDVAAQPRQQRVSYRNPDPSVSRRQFAPSPAAPSPEDLARQEAIAQDMHDTSHTHGASPHAVSERFSKRRKRRHTYWPSVYRPEASDGGKHLGLHKVPWASAETIALENSYLAAAVTDVAKRRMIDEFRYCEVEPHDLVRIQETLRSVETATLNVFVQLYFEHHDPVLPVLHRATFDPDTCDPLLLAAVTCLGALCSRAENAFAYALLTSSLVHAVSYKLIGINHLRGRYLPSMQTLLLTYLLWRNLGDPAKLEYVEGFRNIVLTMARRCRLFELDAFHPGLGLRAGSAQGQEGAESSTAAREQEEEWQSWIRYQEMVRINWALFVLDSDLSLAWDLPSTIMISELRSPLPCPEPLWQAESAAEWSSRLQDETVVLATTSVLRHLFPTKATTHGADIDRSPHAAEASASTAAKITSAAMQHTSPLTQLVLSAAVHNVALSRCNLDTALTQLVFDFGCEDDGDATDRGMTTVPRQDVELEGWVDTVMRRLHGLSASLAPGGRGDAQLMLYGARLRMLVSFKAVQVMSGRKGRRRSKLQMRRWLHGPLQDNEYRNHVFDVASKIFTLSLAVRRDARALQLQSPSYSAGGGMVGSGPSGTPGEERGTRQESRLSNLGPVIVSGTGAENSLLFYATVCLVLLCQWLVQRQRTDRECPRVPSVGEHVAGDSERLSNATPRRTQKDVYFLAGVGALTNPLSLDRLVHVAVHQGLNCSAWPLGQVLGKVLQQWANGLERW
ncbi:hypothetical protein EX895_003445 [Sporisorium graminicola]|uniref:Xylanolytic transcriptional activator regulatory domain-containing protein n=1 Tax=Sporisorium graminicola TaxID=280036 RepID=A0A4U7KTI2_9BASI|nr:hypothetical protein EX895_003445 [Sporisorium graminicola]TKY87864.1 hypothetical protein EX895_003445 [Sporisorium graminicola]